MTLPGTAIVLISVVSAVICNHLARKQDTRRVFRGAVGFLFGPLAIPFLAFRLR